MPPTRSTYPEVAELRRLLFYDHGTGLFFWKVGKKGRRIVAGHRGMYVTIAISGVSYYAHRLAWLWVTGQWPTEDIDHINGDGLDNRFINLRCASRCQNLSNCKIRKDNSSGIKNVSFNTRTQKWIARVSVNKTRRHLGYFSSKEEAAIVVRQATKQYHGKFARVE